MVLGILLSTFLSFSFVISFYLWKDERSRDHPEVIINRFINVIIVSIISLFITYFTYGLKGYNLSLTSFIYGILSIISLFHIPIIEFIKEKEEININFDLKEIRTLIVGPIVEEIVYRLCLYSILKKESFLLISSLLFGLSHLHHFYEHIKYYEIRIIIKILTFQLFYTILFGICCGYLLIKYENIIICILFHSFCNFMGFPQFKIQYLPFYIIGIYLFIKI